MAKLGSSCLSEAWYDDGSASLACFFTDGSVYVYFNVPRAVYDALVGGQASIGGYFNRDIRNDYQYQRT